ncbi:transposase [Streptomyces tendae]|uniref:transposase n=1 Tax=Streptomyces tendae TaxID=1932 RepID=UPI00384D2772
MLHRTSLRTLGIGFFPCGVGDVRGSSSGDQSAPDSVTVSAAPRQFRLDQPVVGPCVPLTDAQWARIEPLLPDRTPKRGGRWRDDREVIDAIAYKFQTGTQWVHLPEKYGNWRGVYNRLRMWERRPTAATSAPRRGPAHDGQSGDGDRQVHRAE